MESNAFLSAVLPTQGKYCTFIQRGDLKKNIFVSTLDNLYDTNINHSDGGKQTYYALSTFDDKGTRAAVNAQYVRSLFIDMDCGVDATTGKAKSFTGKKAAITALYAFLETSGLLTLGHPWLVDSGGGVHAYWPLDEEVEIDGWKPVAEDLKRAAKALNFPIDMTVTADASRVLRMPGTLNWKYTPARPVQLKQRGDTFDLGALASALAPYHVATRKPGSALTLPGNKPSFAALSPVAKAMAGNTTTLFRNIIQRTADGTGCTQVQHYIDHAAEDGMEPMWRAMLSIAKPCDDGDKAARKLSGLHPYDTDRMYMKLAEIKGPYPCAKIDSENPGLCGSCPHWGKITNPLALGRQINTTVDPVVYEIPDEKGNTTPLQRPTPPWGFSYGEKGGVYYHKPADPNKKNDIERDILVLPYDFFMTRMFRDGSENTAEFKAIKGDRIYTFAVNASAATSQADTLKILSSNSVIAAHSSSDAHLYQYVRQSMAQASATGEEVQVPPRFGWQEGGGFAVGDTVFSQHGEAHDYTFVSNGMSNIISATQCAGTLEEWRKPYMLMMDKGLWGHLVMGGMGFASILMEFMPAGSRTATVHICGTHSGLGKSYALGLASAVWGDSKKFEVKATTSRTTLMQRAGFFGSLPLMVDEITNSQRETEREYVPKLVFDFSSGGHKIKGSNNGNAEIDNELFWSSIMLMTSNTPALEAMMGARATTSEGEARRLLEWVMPRDRTLNWDTEEERATSQLLTANYGVAGRAFAKWCVCNREVVQQVCHESLLMWREYSGATDDERFWSAGVAANIAAFILLGNGTAKRPFSGVLPGIPLSKVRDFWLESVVSPARQVIETNQLSAKDMLDAYLRENNVHLVQVNSSAVMSNLGGKSYAITPDSNRRLVRGRVERNLIPGIEDVFIEAKMLKQHCANMNHGYAEFLQELNNVYLVREGRKDLLAGTNGPTMRVHCVRVTRNLKGDARVALP